MTKIANWDPSLYIITSGVISGLKYIFLASYNLVMVPFYTVHRLMKQVSLARMRAILGMILMSICTEELVHTYVEKKLLSLNLWKARLASLGLSHPFLLMSVFLAVLQRLTMWKLWQ